MAEGTPEQVTQVEASHTGRLLKEAFARSRYAEREAFDFESYRRSLYEVQKEEELAGKTRMPWQTDGRKWHLQDRLTREGGKTLWDPKVLEVIVDQVLADSAFEVKWDDRDEFRLAVKGKRMPFIVARSTEPRYALLHLRAPKRKFTMEEIRRRLAWPPFNKLQGYPVYSSWERIWSRSGGATFDEFHFAPAVMEDVQSPEMRNLLQEAMESFKALVASNGGRREAVRRFAEPARNRSWHLERKERDGHPIAWEPGTILAFEKLVQPFGFVEPADWSDAEKVVFRVQDAKFPFAEITTDWWERLELLLRARKGDFEQESLLERLDLEGFLEDWPPSFDRISLRLLSPRQLETRSFREFLRKYAEGFRKIMIC